MLNKQTQPLIFKGIFPSQYKFGVKEQLYASHAMFVIGTLVFGYRWKNEEWLIQNIYTTRDPNCIVNVAETHYQHLLLNWTPHILFDIVSNTQKACNKTIFWIDKALNDKKALLWGLQKMKMTPSAWY